MLKITTTLLLLLGLGFGTSVLAQEAYMEIENGRGKTVRTYRVGDEMEYRMVDSKDWKKDIITYYDAESGYIGMSNELIHLKDIDKIRYRSDAFLQALRIALYTAAVSVTLGTAVSVINENEDPKILLYGVPFAAVAMLIPKKRNRVIRLRGKYILKIVDLPNGFIEPSRT